MKFTIGQLYVEFRRAYFPRKFVGHMPGYYVRHFGKKGQWILKLKYWI